MSIFVFKWSFVIKQSSNQLATDCKILDFKKLKAVQNCKQKTVKYIIVKRNAIFNFSDAAYWDTVASAELQNALYTTAPNTNKARNVILFVGDGMGLNTNTAARIYKGQLRNEGVKAERGHLIFEEFPHLGLLKVCLSIDSKQFNYSRVRTDLQCWQTSARLGQHRHCPVLWRQGKPQDGRGGRKRQIGGLRGVSQHDISSQIHHSVGASVGNEDWWLLICTFLKPI
jgi:hypothetical protein